MRSVFSQNEKFAAFTRILKFLFFPNKCNQYFWCQPVIFFFRKWPIIIITYGKKKSSIWKRNLNCFMSCNFWQKRFIRSQKLLQLLTTTRLIQILPIHCFLILGQLNFELFRIPFCYPCISLCWRQTVRDGKVSVNFPAAAFFLVNLLWTNIFLEARFVWVFVAMHRFFFSEKFSWTNLFFHFPPPPPLPKKKTFLMLRLLSITWQH